MPNASSSTLTIGTKQFVVQLALETTLCVLRVEVGVVDAHHERAVGAVGRGRDDDERGAGVEVGGGLVPGGEEAGRLDDEVDAEVGPRQLGRVADLQHLQLVVADLDAVLRRP